MKFEIWQSTKNRNWYWHLKASNNLIIANGEGYVNKADCLHVVSLIKTNAVVTPVSEISNPAGR